MAGILAEVVPQHPDRRSRDFALRVTVSNASEVDHKLISITPRVPDGAHIAEVSEPATKGQFQEHGQLCAELTKLLQSHLLQHNVEYTAGFRSKAEELYVENHQSLQADAHFTDDLFGRQRRAVKRLSVADAGRLRAALAIRVRSEAQAKLAFETFMEDASPIVRDTYRFKLQQLAEIQGGSEAASYGNGVLLRHP